MMDRCDEAKIYLEPRFIATLKEDDFIRRASPDWDASSLNAAQAILEYNVLVLMVLKDEIDLAKSLIGRVKHPLLITHLKRLTIYLEMRSGNIERCRNLVGVDSPHLWNERQHFCTKQQKSSLSLLFLYELEFFNFYFYSTCIFFLRFIWWFW